MRVQWRQEGGANLRVPRGRGGGEDRGMQGCSDSGGGMIVAVQAAAAAAAAVAPAAATSGGGGNASLLLVGRQPAPTALHPSYARVLIKSVRAEARREPGTLTVAQHTPPGLGCPRTASQLVSGGPTPGQQAGAALPTLHRLATEAAGHMGSATSCYLFTRGAQPWCRGHRSRPVTHLA